MLTGSLVSSLQGEPRATHDIDLVIDFPAARIDDLLREFPPPDFYLNRSAMEQAIQQRSMFNLLDVREGDKVDFWLLTEDEFDQSRFTRRMSVDFEGTAVQISSPDDTILMKLRWSQDAGGSEKQLRDAVRVYEMQKDRLDLNYISYWVDRLGLRPSWERLVADANPLE